MYPTVTVAQQDRPALYLTIVEPIVLGRECDGLLLADEKVSRQHLRLGPGVSGVIVTDLGSTNGSFIDGARIEGQTTLRTGSTLLLGDTTVRVEPVPTPAAKSQATARDVGGTIVATVTSDGIAQAVSDPPATPLGPPLLGGNETRRTTIEELEASLRGQRIPVPSGSADDTVTIMFSDIESSTEIALGMGDQRWYQILTTHNQLVEERVAAHAGFIVKNQGDGFMITFNSARRAIICACEIQQALHAMAVADPSMSVRVRIGMHTGEAIRQDSGDLFGRHVIIAARVGATAAGGEILVSSIVREIASARGDLHFGEPQVVDLKGVGEQPVYPVLWGAELPST